MTPAVSAVTPSAAPGAARSGVLDRWEPVIGIEVHCQLRTASKMFCACSNAYDGAPPNSLVCPVCLGLPGALPTINRRAVEGVLATGAAIGATTPGATRWDRKNYFYPDLPKGYQISQYDLPLAANGRLTVETSAGPVTIGITRAHLEEDTAKLIHATDDAGRKVSLVDFNRSGAPLMEIVTDPDLRTAEQARRYAEELQMLLRAIDVSDADMERGQMRVEANVSLRRRGTEAFGTRVEVKNMNSFRSVERAIDYEIERQAAALDEGQTLTQDTRGWDDARGATYVMRSKEDSHDYRYFPEPDLPPLRVDPAWLEAIRAALPELPAARRARYASALGLSSYDAAVIVADPLMSIAFEAVLEAAGAADIGAARQVPAKEVANLVMGDYAKAAKATTERTPEGLVGRASAVELARLIGRVVDGGLSRANAKQVLEEHLASGEPVAAIVAARGLAQISDTDELAVIVERVVADNPKAVADYRAGKPTVRFLVGQVMKATGGQANAGLVQEAIQARLDAAPADVGAQPADDPRADQGGTS
jgi:aspartyl-tRNA(Asn)/glutamyl-tRNA(Gln) amidotransferase subunit B